MTIRLKWSYNTFSIYNNNNQHIATVNLLKPQGHRPKVIQTCTPQTEGAFELENRLENF